MFAILVHVIHRYIDAVIVGELKAVDVAVKSRHMEFHPCLVKFRSPFDEGMVLSEPVIEQLASTLRSEEHTSELQSLLRISYVVLCLKKKTIIVLNNILVLIKKIRI